MLHLEWAKRLRKAGEVLQREGLSKRAAAIMVELLTTTGSYKAAMVAVGRMKAIAQAAKYDDYWTEQVDDGFQKEMRFLEAEAKRVAEARQSASGRELAHATETVREFDT